MTIDFSFYPHCKKKKHLFDRNYIPEPTTNLHVKQKNILQNHLDDNMFYFR